MATLKLARNAMATRFEIVLPGENEVALRAAGEEALDEIERLENRLSLYRPGSEIAQLNAHAATYPIRISPALFHLLQRSRDLSVLTTGAFDITVAPLVRCWGFMKSSGTMPALEEVAAAREKIGMHLLEFDEANYTIRFTREGVMLDLGSIGKGYAIDRAVELLKEAGVENALIHGGTSTVYALGENRGEGPWKVAVDRPSNPQQSLSLEQQVLAVVTLRDQALSVSAVWGKSFSYEGRNYGHVIDPRTGWPVEDGLLAAVIVPTATESDALSTAVLLANHCDLKQLSGRVPEMSYLKLFANDFRQSEIVSNGINAEIH